MNRDFLVSGAAQGLGQEFTRRILMGGGRVLMADINTEKGQETLKLFQKDFGENRVRFHQLDVTKEDSWKSTWEEAENFFGGPVEAFCNNAGIAGGNWKNVKDVNMDGALMGAMMAFDKMGVSKGGKGGLMVITGSVASFLSGGLQTVENSVYDVTKHGVLGFVRAVKGEIYHRDMVRTVGICPWFTDTNIVRSNMSSHQISSMKSTFGFPMMKVEEVGQRFERLVVNGKSGDMCVIMPGTSFMWPDWHRKLMLYFIILSKTAVKVFGLNPQEIVTSKSMLQAALFLLLTVFLLFHILLSYIGY